MMPAVEADGDVPDAVDDDFQLLVKDLGLRGFVAGAMRYGQVALQRMFDRSELSYPQLASLVGITVDKLGDANVLAFDTKAYQDAKTLADRLVNAIETKEPTDWSEAIEDEYRMMVGSIVLAIAAAHRLAEGFGRSPTEAANRLSLDVGSLQPTNETE